MKLDEQGIFHLPMAMATFILLASGVLIFGILRDIRHNAENQLRLDRCVAQVARELRSILNSIETDNPRIEMLRDEIAASVEFPVAQATARAALMVVVLHQE